MRLVIWAWSTCSIWCVTGSFGLTWLPRQENISGSTTHALPLKPGSPKPPQKHHGHTPSRAGPTWLPVPGTWERPGWECSGGHRPFHQVCPGICDQDPNCYRFSPYYLIYGRQPHLPVDVTLGLAPHTITGPSTSKFVQKWGNTPNGLKEKLKPVRQKRHKDTSKIMTKGVKQWPLKSETWS